MLKNKRGISLTTAIVTVILLFIILGTLVYSATDSLKIRKLNKLYNDIRQLDDAVATYYLENKKLPVKGAIVIVDFNENSSVHPAIYGAVNGKSTLTSIDDFVNPNDFNPETGKAEYQVIEKQLLKNISLSEDGDYIINLKSHTIYYMNGLTVDGKKYYTIPRTYTNLNLNR